MPKARRTKAFDDDPTQEFLFALAAELGVWDVDDMFARMPNHLLMRWGVYFARRNQREQLKALEAQNAQPS